jgi:dethiobiotin synthetase
MTERIAVVGTDTGVGKTIITGALVGILRESNRDARAVKPAQTGFPPDDDAGVIADICDDPAAATCLRYLEAPLAPAVAAEREGVDLSYDTLRQETATALDACEIGIVEGIGGLRVPLADGREVIDLVTDLGCQVVIVARSGLGTLNHTRLTLEALSRRGVPVLGVVLNEFDGGTVAERTNPDQLRTVTDAPVVTMPTVERDDLIITAREQLAPVVDRLDPKSRICSVDPT